MVIKQGDIYWIDGGTPPGSNSQDRRPYVVIQNNLFIRSRLQTVLVCAVTSNPKRAEVPGNVLLPPGEANLPAPSVINVAQVFTVDKNVLVDKIGTLSLQRVRQILKGLQLVLEPRDLEQPST